MTEKLRSHAHTHTHNHQGKYRGLERKRLELSLFITLIVMIVEVVGGLLSNSIALLTDAGHMFTHLFAITISIFGIYLASKPACHHKTFGLYRAEILTAFINGLFLLAITGVIIYEGVLRLFNPVEINSLAMISVAIIGLVVNIISILLLQGTDKKDLNIKGVFYHMVGDSVSSVGVVIASIIIYFTGWWILDPIVSFFIAALIIKWAIGILRDSARILLEIAPEGLSVDIVETDLEAHFEEIEDVQHTHIWTITPELLVLTTHVRLSKSVGHDEFIDRIAEYLHKTYNIAESTIQITYKEDIKSCQI